MTRERRKRIGRDVREKGKEGRTERREETREKNIGTENLKKRRNGRWYIRKKRIGRDVRNKRKDWKKRREKEKDDKRREA